MMMVTTTARPRMVTAAPPSRPALAVVLAGMLFVGVFVAALLLAGGRPVAPPTGLADAGSLTRWSLLVVDLLVRLLALLTVGQLVYAALLAPAPDGPAPGTLPVMRGTAWSAAGWLSAEITAVVLTASDVLGVPLTGLTLQAVMGVATELPAGRAALVVAGMLVVVAVGSAQLVRRNLDALTRTAAVVLLLLALGAVVVPGVLAGHSAAAEDHLPAVLALSAHVVTASLWVGGLAGLLLHGRAPAVAVTTVRRFSAMALACVVVLLLSGTVAVLLVAGPPSWSWTGEGWAWLLILKTVSLGLLATMGWWHRRRTLPALAAGRPGAFLRLATVEMLVMATTIALSVALAATPAPREGAPATGAGPQHGMTTAGLDPYMPPQSEDMSGHDHGDLSVSILVDEQRLHVPGPVLPGQPVTVFNSTDSPVTVTALDGSFEAEVPAQALITFAAPDDPGSYRFLSRSTGGPVGGLADTLLVRP